jgi:hypothetical protein
MLLNMGVKDKFILTLSPALQTGVAAVLFQKARQACQSLIVSDQIP